MSDYKSFNKWEQLGRVPKVDEYPEHYLRGMQGGKDVAMYHVDQTEPIPSDTPFTVWPTKAWRRTDNRCALVPNQPHDAVHATNQPDWVSEGKVFVTLPDGSDTILLSTGDYYFA